MYRCRPIAIAAVIVLARRLHLAAGIIAIAAVIVLVRLRYKNSRSSTSINLKFDSKRVGSALEGILRVSWCLLGSVSWIGGLDATHFALFTKRYHDNKGRTLPAAPAREAFSPPSHSPCSQLQCSPFTLHLFPASLCAADTLLRPADVCGCVTFLSSFRRRSSQSRTAIAVVAFALARSRRTCVFL